MDTDLVLRLLKALAASKARYVIVGGVALNLQGLARATTDIDMFVEPTADNVERVKAALREVFADPEIDNISAQDLMGDYPAVQYVPPEGPFHVDILTRLGEAFAYADIESEVRDFAGVPARIATPRMLYLMKRDTVRLQDKADAERLRERFKIEDD